MTVKCEHFTSDGGTGSSAKSARASCRPGTCQSNLVALVVGFCSFKKKLDIEVFLKMANMRKKRNCESCNVCSSGLWIVVQSSNWLDSSSCTRRSCPGIGPDVLGRSEYMALAKQDMKVNQQIDQTRICMR